MAKKKVAPSPTATDDSAETLAGDQTAWNEEAAVADEWERTLPLANYDQLPAFDEELIYTWVAPQWVYRPRVSKVYLRNLILLLFLIILLLIFLNQFATLTVVLAVIFLAYVLANVPPQKVRHTISNYGIYTNNGTKFYSWADRGKRFWWEDDHGQKTVVVETRLFPYRVVMLVGAAANEEPIRAALAHYLMMQKPAPAEVEKIIGWFKRKFPLE